MHSISGCLSSSPIPQPMDSISDCIPMSPYSLPMNLRLHSHESLSPFQIFESFGWVPSMSFHPDSGMPLGFHQLRPERDFRGTPYNHTWVPLKSIVERFRCLLRDFCFWAIFLGFPNRKNLDLRRRSAYQRKRGDWSTTQSPQMVIQNGSGMTK